MLYPIHIPLLLNHTVAKVTLFPSLLYPRGQSTCTTPAGVNN